MHLSSFCSNFVADSKWIKARIEIIKCLIKRCTPDIPLHNDIRCRSYYLFDMTREEMKELNLTPIEDLITEDFGAEGTPTRVEFDADVDAFILGERLKEERQKAGLTQEQLAEKIGTKKSYISRVENGHADIQFSTLLKIFQGLGRRVSLTIL